MCTIHSLFEREYIFPILPRIDTQFRSKFQNHSKIWNFLFFNRLIQMIFNSFTIILFFKARTLKRILISYLYITWINFSTFTKIGTFFSCTHCNECNGQKCYVHKTLHSLQFLSRVDDLIRICCFFPSTKMVWKKI